MQKSVLIVEDEFLIAMDIQWLLERNGWQVIGPALTIDMALRLLAEQQPAVAILDVTLKDGTVTPVAEVLRARNVPFVVASAYSHPEVIGGKVLAGAPNVGKPTEEHRLLAILERIVS